MNLRRLIDNWRFRRRLERNLRARREARLNGRTYVAGYTRRRPQ